MIKLQRVNAFAVSSGVESLQWESLFFRISRQQTFGPIKPNLVQVLIIMTPAQGTQFIAIG
jgi:hypothetical protein